MSNNTVARASKIVVVIIFKQRIRGDDDRVSTRRQGHPGIRILPNLLIDEGTVVGVDGRAEVADGVVFEKSGGNGWGKRGL